MNYEYVLKNMRAQYKIPDSLPNTAENLPTIKKWLTKMGASKYMIRLYEKAFWEGREGRYEIR